jgi:tRNA A37 methylthiotransferase MiaB
MKFSIITDQLCVLSKVNIGAFYKKMMDEGNEIVRDYMSADIIFFHPCRLVKINEELVDKIKRKNIKVIFCYREEDFKKVKNVEFISNSWIEDSRNFPVYQRNEESCVYVGSGCARNCSYCPIKRKKSVNRKIEDVLRDTKGATRVMLCADDCSSYKYGLVELMEKMPQQKIHLSYVYPSYLIQNADYFVKNKERISLDVLPIQSGSERILRMMNRSNYNLDRVVEVANHIKINKLHFMFGYPTEAWEDFLQTIEFENKINKIEELSLWFVYRPYDGTKSKEDYGEYKSPFLDKMKKYLSGESKHDRVVLDFLDKGYGSIVVDFNEKGEMFFYNSEKLDKSIGSIDKNGTYNPPLESLGETIKKEIKDEASQK